MDDLRKLAHAECKAIVPACVPLDDGGYEHSRFCDATTALLVRAVDGALLDAIRVVIEAPPIVIATGGVFIGQESTTEKLRVLRAKLKGTP